MLAVARALVNDNDLLLIDEPTEGLSPLYSKNLLKSLSQLKETNTILLVEQNARMALELAQRAYVMETGLVTLSGTGKELAENEAVRKAYLGAT